MRPRPHAMLAASLLALGGLAASSRGGEVAFELRRPGTFPLDARLSLPDGVSPGTATRVVVLLHGSGPQSMDEDLDAATEAQAPNPFFADLAERLVAHGFAVLRYHKRSFQARLRLEEDPGFARSPEFQALAADPLGHFLDDAGAALDWARERLPNAARLLLGHSQGTHLALWQAHRRDDLAGLALIGFSLGRVSELVFDQTVHRPLVAFRRLDQDRDGSLSLAELAGTDPTAVALRAQRDVLDLDGDGAISEVEVQAGNLSNSLLHPTFPDEYLRVEATLPKPEAVLRELEIPVAFFQGEWDNQTPVYHAKAVDLVHRKLWTERRLLFRYYPERGHALDPRTRPDDLVYRRADPAALEDVAAQMDRFFR